MAEKNEKEKKYLFLIEFEDEILMPFIIKRISKSHEIKGEDEYYYITINQMDEDESNQPFKNIIFKYSTEESRDKALKLLKDKLQSLGYIKFV
jgi:hypothetical protein